MLHATSAVRGPGAPEAPRTAREALDAVPRSWQISIGSPTEIPEGPQIVAEPIEFTEALLDAKPLFQRQRLIGQPGAAFATKEIGLGLIRFCGHFPKGGYDVHTDGRHLQESARAPAVRWRLQSAGGAASAR